MYGNLCTYAGLVTTNIIKERTDFLVTKHHIHAIMIVIGAFAKHVFYIIFKI